MRPITDNEFKKVEAALETYPDLKKYIDGNLIKFFFNTPERLKQHPLFWYLLRDGNAEKLSNNLKILESNCNKFKRILNKIHDKDNTGFHSSMSEVDVLSYYYSKVSDDFQVEYEPDIKEKGTKVDANITTNNKDFFIEIFTVFPDQNYQKIDKIHQNIRTKIDDFEDNPYIICYTIYEEFTEEDIDHFVVEMKKIIDENSANEQNANQEDPEVDEMTITRKGIDIAHVRLYRDKKVKKGFVGSMMSPFQKVEDAGRIKQKVLTKIDQLPSQGRNIVVVNLSKIFGDKFYDMDDAFLGQKTVLVDKVTFEGSPGRHANGIVHHEKGIYISMIIAYINDDYSTRRYYINDATAIEQLDQEEWKLF